MKHFKNLISVLIVAMLLLVSIGAVCADDFDDGNANFDETINVYKVGGACDVIYEPVPTSHECWVIFEPNDDLDEGLDDDSDWDLGDDDLDDDFDWDLGDDDLDDGLDDDFDWDLDDDWDEDFDWDSYDDDLEDGLDDDFDWDFDDDWDEDFDWDLGDDDFDWNLDDDLDDDFDWDFDDDWDEDFDWDSYDDDELYGGECDGIDLDDDYAKKRPILLTACLDDADNSYQAGEYSNLNVLAVTAPSIDAGETNSTDDDVNVTQSVALQEDAEDANIFALLLMMLMVALTII